jgi:hypothetical protein
MIVLSIIFLYFMCCFCYICFSQFTRKLAATRGAFNYFTNFLSHTHSLSPSYNHKVER